MVFEKSWNHFFSKGFFVCMSTVLVQNSKNFYTCSSIQYGTLVIIQLEQKEVKTQKDLSTSPSVKKLQWCIDKSIAISSPQRPRLIFIQFLWYKYSRHCLFWNFRVMFLNTNSRRDIHGQLSWPGTDNVKLYVFFFFFFNF